MSYTQFKVSSLERNQTKLILVSLFISTARALSLTKSWHHRVSHLVVTIDSLTKWRV